MRSKHNGFTKFICRIEGKEISSLVTPWPKECVPSILKDFVYNIISDYKPGNTLTSSDRWSLEDAFIWSSSEIERECMDLYYKRPLSKKAYQVFKGWHDRFERGEVPSKRNE